MMMLRNIFIVFCVLFFGLNVTAQSFPEKGVGQWHTLPFADVRLLSCTTGSLDRTLLVGGLQIKIHPGWILKKPDLKTLSENGILDYPIRPNSVNTTQYTGTILLPLVYKIQNEKKFYFGVEGNLEGCWDDNCLTIPIRVEIPLNYNESNYTSFCAYIMDEMGQTPKLDLQIGIGEYIDNHTAILRFHVSDIHQAFLQNQNGLNFKILQTQIWKDDVQFTVSYPETWYDDTIQDWILISNQGVFRVPIHLKSTPLPPISYSRPWSKFLIVGLLLFICSPFFILWGISFPKTTRELKNQCSKTLVVSTLLTIFVCIVMKYFPNLDCDVMSPFVLVIMGITLAFPPRFFWWAGLLFIVWPKPYLQYIVNVFPLWYLISWLALWQIVPFFILYKYAKFWGKKARFSLKKAPFCHCLFFLLPTIIMLIYGIYDVNLCIFYKKVADFKNPTLICEKKNCASWIESGLNIDFINSKGTEGRTLLNLYQASKNLLIFDDNGIQTILVDTTPQKLRKYLNGLKNYRAGYKPVHPLVRSVDVQHDLLSNAK